MTFLFGEGLVNIKKRPLPWETGVAGMVLDTRNSFGILGGSTLRTQWDESFILAASLQILDPAVEPELLVAQPPEERHVGSAVAAFELVAKRKEPLPWSDKVDDDRKVALGRWKLLLDQNPAATTVGLKLSLLTGDPNASAKAHNILVDTFFDKSTDT